MATQEMTAARSETRIGSGPQSFPARISPRSAAQALGWFSVGLGLTELLAPGALSRFIGVPKRNTTMRLMGLREIFAGIGLLTARRPAPWFWARAGGDLIDLAALAKASNSRRANGARVSAAIGAVAGVTALDVICARQSESTSQSVHFTASVAINKPPETCYHRWRDIAGLPSFLDHLKAVHVIDERRSHWVLNGPTGNDIEWDAEITEDVPNDMISWRSMGGDFQNWGRIRFEAAPGNRGTIVRLLMNYELAPKMGGPILSRIFGADPAQRARRDLLRFKQLLETGEIATTKGQAAGKRTGANWMDRMVRV